MEINRVTRTEICSNWKNNVNKNVTRYIWDPAKYLNLHISTGYKVGSHRIQGISDEFIPSIVKLNQLDRVVKASDGDSIIVAQQLSKQLGLAVGISSGGNIIGAIQLQNELGADSDVVTVFSDSNKKYLSTDLMKDEPIKDGYYSNYIEFLDYKAISRRP